MSENKDLTLQFKEIVLRDDYQGCIDFFNQHYLNIKLGKRFTFPLKNTDNLPATRVHSLMFYIFDNINFESLFEVIIKKYISSSEFRKTYNMIQDSHITWYIEFFMEKERFYEIECIFGSKENVNKHIYAKGENSLVFSMLNDHIAKQCLIPFISYFNPTQQDLERRPDNSILHFLADGVICLSSEDLIDKSSFFVIIDQFDFFIQKYKLCMRLQNEKGYTFLEFILKDDCRSKENKLLKDFIFKHFLITNNNWTDLFDLNKLLINNDIGKADFNYFNKIMMDVKKSEVILNDL